MSYDFRKKVNAALAPGPLDASAVKSEIDRASAGELAACINGMSEDVFWRLSAVLGVKAKLKDEAPAADDSKKPGNPAPSNGDIVSVFPVVPMKDATELPNSK